MMTMTSLMSFLHSACRIQQRWVRIVNNWFWHWIITNVFEWYWFWPFFVEFIIIAFDIDFLTKFQYCWWWYWNKRNILAHLWYTIVITSIYDSMFIFWEKSMSIVVTLIEWLTCISFRYYNAFCNTIKHPWSYQRNNQRQVAKYADCNLQNKKRIANHNLLYVLLSPISDKQAD